MEIIKSGLHTTIQDIGRVGCYHLGVPPSGAADKKSYILGNILIGNPKEYAALEMKLQGCTIKFSDENILVVTGAPVTIRLNNKNQNMWEVFKVNEDDILEIKKIESGVFSYLCISGGIKSPSMFGSQSTCLASDFPGIIGRALLPGDFLELPGPLPGANRLIKESLSKEAIPLFTDEIKIRIVLGITSDLISDEGLVSILNDSWSVQADSNKVAYRLRGGKVTYKKVKPPFGSGGELGNIVDIPYPIGAVIIPNDKEIIILLNNGTGGGGFVTVGAIIWSDVNRLAQMRPSSKIEFEAITIEQAMIIRKEENDLIENVKRSMKI